MDIGLFIPLTKILDSLSNLLAKVYEVLINLKIPDLALIAIVLLLLIWILIVSKRVERRLERRIDEIKRVIKRAGIEDFQEELKQRKVEEEPKRKEEEPKEVAEELKEREEELKESEEELKETAEEPKEEREEFKEAMKEIREEAKVEEKAAKKVEAPEEERVESIFEVTEKKVMPEKPEIKEVREKPVIEEKIALNREDIFVLSAIADEPEKMYQKEGLFSLFRMAFSTKSRLDFDFILKKLEKYKLIKSNSSTDYRAWIEMTDKGLEYIKRRRKI